MTTDRKNTLLITLLVAAAIALAFAVSGKSNAFALGSQDETRGDTEPVVDYDEAVKKNTAQGKKRKNLGLRTDRPVAELPWNIEPLPVGAHWWIGLPALPAAQSDAVIRGELVGGQALLDPDKMGVYSEFSVRIGDTYKAAPGLLTPGSVVTATRPGGAVRFPSGKIQRYRIGKQGFPKQGGQYILFLRCDEQGGLSILTGYELRAGRVLPLDGDGKDPRADLQFGKYRGAAEETFMRDLREAVQSSLPGKGR